MSYAYRCGPTAISSRSSWGPESTLRPLSGHFDRIFNSFERSDAFELVNGDERRIARASRVSSSFERAECSLAAHPPSLDDDDYYREKVLYSQARQLYPLQEDLADWINKTIGITYLTGENFLDVLDNGVEVCQLAAVIHDRAKEALDQGLIVGPVPSIRGRCWQRAARRSFFSRDNTENFLTFCRELGVHENLLFESDDLVLHNQPRQVILCLLEVARLATRYGIEPPGLVQLEKEIAMEERDSGLDSAMSSAGWQFRGATPSPPRETSTVKPALPPAETNENQALDTADNESTKSGGTVDSSDSDVPLKPTNELDKRVQLVTRLMERGCSCGAGKCSRLLKVKKVGEGRYNIAGRNVFIRLLKGRHMMVRVGGGWDTLEHFLSRHEPCQVRLVTQGRRASLLPVPLSGSTSPVDSKASLSGTTSPVDRAPRTRSSSRLSSGQTSPVEEPRRTSTPKPLKTARTALTLPLKPEDKPAPRLRKQSAPSFSTPNTPTARTAKTPPAETRKPITTTNIPKKSRSMSLAIHNDKKPSNPTKARSLATTPTETPRKVRSQSLASTPVEPKKSFCGTEKLNGHAKKTRSMSLATTPVAFRPINKSGSVPGTGLTQAAIEESIRLSLAATIEDQSTNKPFLHIKAKYRSPPPREVPPR